MHVGGGGIEYSVPVYSIAYTFGQYQYNCSTTRQTQMIFIYLYAIVSVELSYSVLLQPIRVLSSVCVFLTNVEFIFNTSERGCIEVL